MDLANSQHPQDVSSELYALLKRNPQEQEGGTNLNPSLSSIKYPSVPAQNPPPAPYGSSAESQTPQYRQYYPEFKSKTPPPSRHPSHPPVASGSSSYPTTPNPSIQPVSEGSSQPVAHSPQLTMAQPSNEPVRPVEVCGHLQRLEGESVTFDVRLSKTYPLTNIIEISAAEPEAAYAGNRLITSNKDFLACVTRNRLIRVFHKYSSNRGVFKRHTEPVTEVRFMSRESNITASVSEDGVLIVWEVSNGDQQFGFNILYRFQAESRVTRMAWNPQDNLQLIFACANGSLIMCDFSKVVSQEDTAPTMDYLIEENDEDSITSVEFAWHGRQFVTASRAGMLIVWDTESLNPIKEWIPHGYIPINNARILGSSVAPQYSDFIVTSARDNRELKLWTMEGQCLQTLVIHADFPFDTFEQETSSKHLLLASSSAPYMCVLRLAVTPNENCQFDLAAEFDTGNEVLSTSAISQPKGDCVHIGVFSMLKNKGVCLFHISAVDINWPPSGTPLEPIPSVSGQQPQAEPQPNLQESSDLKEPLSTTQQAPVGEQQEKKGKGKKKTGEPDTNSNQKALSISKPSKANKQDENTQSLSAEHVTEASVVKPGSYVSTDGLQTMIEHTVLEALDRQRQSMEREAKERRKAEKQRQKDLIKEISKVLSEDIPDAVEQSVDASIESSLLPGLQQSLTVALENKILSSLQRSVDAQVKSMLPKLEKTVQQDIQAVLSKELANSMPKNMEQTIHRAVQHNLRSNFQELVIPSFEEICRRMFAQISDAFQRGLQDHVANIPSNNASEAILQQLQAITQRLDRLESLQQQKSDHTQAPHQPGPPARPRLTESDIQRLIAAKDYDRLLLDVLSASNLNLLHSVCSRLNAAEVFSSNLSSVVLLSLIQQLGFDLTAHTKMKTAWLRKAILKAGRSRDSVLAQKAPAIFAQVQQNAQKAINSVAEDDAEELMVLSHLISGLAHK